MGQHIIQVLLLLSGFQLFGQADSAFITADHYKTSTLDVAIFPESYIDILPGVRFTPARQEIGSAEKLLGEIGKCRPTREAEIFASYTRRLWSSLARIEQPVLALHGRDTFAFARRSVTRWAAGNGNVECVQVEGGHCFMLEHPQATAERVAAFLLEHPR